MTTKTIKLTDAEAEYVAKLSDEELAAYKKAQVDADVQIRLAEIAYNMRVQAGLSQTELARRMGVSQPVVARIERGGRTPTVATIARLAAATGNKLELNIVPA